MIAQPLVTSSGWTLISLLIHVRLIWTDYWSYLYCTTKKLFFVFCFFTNSVAPPSHIRCFFTQAHFAVLLPAVFSRCLLKQHAREVQVLGLEDSIGAIVNTCKSI